MRHRFLAFHRPRRAGRHRFLEGLRMFLLKVLRHRRTRPRASNRLRWLASKGISTPISRNSMKFKRIRSDRGYISTQI